MAKQRIRLRGTRTQSKIAQKKLMEKLKVLYENPLILLPRCEHEGETCPYEQLKNNLKETKDYFDNPPSGISSWFKGPPRDKTARAVLSSFEILDNGKLPVVAVAKFPTGDATYAVRGTGIPKEKMIGVQNYEHQSLRMLLHLNYVKKDGINLYSVKNGMICTGKTPRYPIELWNQAVSEIKCNEEEQKFGMAISSKSLQKKIFLNSNVWKKSNKNSFSSFIKYQMPPNNGDIDVEIKTPLSEKAPITGGSILEDYKAGKITDKDLRTQIIKKQKKHIAESSEAVVIVGEQETSLADFKEKSKLNDLDREIVSKLFDAVNSPIFLTDYSLSQLSENLWTEYIRVILEEKEPNLIERYNGNNALELLRKTLERKITSEKMKGLPEFTNLHKSVKLADNIAKIYRSKGKAAASKRLISEDLSDHTNAAILWGFLSCLGIEKGEAWKYEESAMSFGNEVKNLIEPLLHNSDKEYLKSLTDLSKRLGHQKELEVI